MTERHTQVDCNPISSNPFKTHPNRPESPPGPRSGTVGVHRSDFLLCDSLTIKLFPFPPLLTMPPFPSGCHPGAPSKKQELSVRPAHPQHHVRHRPQRCLSLAGILTHRNEEEAVADDCGRCITQTYVSLAVCGCANLASVSAVQRSQK